MIRKVIFLGQINPKQNMQQRSTVTKPLGCDCFVRNADAKVENDFINWARENNFIPNGLSLSLRDENLLGRGFSNVVYQIPNNDNYVLRLRRFNKEVQDLDLTGYKLYDTQDPNLEGNFGQCVAEIRNNNQSNPIIEVLKKQNGIANGNPPPTAIYHKIGSIEEELPYEARGRKEHYAKCLQILADMPQEAYDDVVKKISQIGELGYKFDFYNANNFMLDEEGGQINIIDLDKISKGYKNDLGSALWALSNIEYLNTFYPLLMAFL